MTPEIKQWNHWIFVRIQPDAVPADGEPIVVMRPTQRDLDPNTKTYITGDGVTTAHDLYGKSGGCYFAVDFNLTQRWRSEQGPDEEGYVPCPLDVQPDKAVGLTSGRSYESANIRNYSAQMQRAIMRGWAYYSKFPTLYPEQPSTSLALYEPEDGETPLSSAPSVVSSKVSERLAALELRMIAIEKTLNLTL